MPTLLPMPNVHSASHGTVTHDNDKVTFIPDVDFTGTATFRYEVSDGYRASVATVSVDVVAN